MFVRGFVLGLFGGLLSATLLKLPPGFGQDALAAVGNGMMPTADKVEETEDAPKIDGKDDKLLQAADLMMEPVEQPEAFTLDGMMELMDPRTRLITGDKQLEEEHRMHDEYLREIMKKHEATLAVKRDRVRARLEVFDSHDFSVHDSSDHGRRRLWGGWLRRAYNRARSDMYYYMRRYYAYRSYYYSAYSSYRYYYSRFWSYYHQANRLAKDVSNQAVEITNLKQQIHTLKETLQYIQDLPAKLTNEMVHPIESRYNTIKDDITSLDNIASSVADSAVEVIKKYNVIPTAEDLIDYFVDFMKKFMSQSFCVPYECIAALQGKTLRNINLKTTTKYSLKTTLEPKTCVRIKDIGLNPSSMQNFLDLFGGFEAINKILDEVRDFLVDMMSQVLALTDDVMDLVDQIVTLVDQGVDTIKKIVPARRLMSVETGETISMTEAAALAHEKGVEKFNELFDAHVRRVWHERQLSSRAADYVVIDTLDLEVSADFTQTFDFNFLKRSGNTGNVLQKAEHKSAVFPVPFTFGNIKFIANGGMEASIPYAISAEGEINARFGYNVGQTNFSYDVIRDTASFSRKDFNTFMNVTGTGQVSGFISLEFGANAGFGLCIGQTDDLCLTIEIDAFQNTAAGFDTLAALALGKGNYTALEPMYTDVIQYDPMKTCDENEFSVKAGYWQYVMEPAFTVSLVGPAGCNGNTLLYANKPKPLSYMNDTFCVKTSNVPYV